MIHTDEIQKIETGFTYEIELKSIATQNREAIDALEPIFDALRKVSSLELKVGKVPVTLKFV